MGFFSIPKPKPKENQEAKQSYRVDVSMKKIPDEPDVDPDHQESYDV